MTSSTAGGPGPDGGRHHVGVFGQAQVGVIGDGTNTVNIVTPRREISWPVVVGSPPPLATAYQHRTGIAHAMADHSAVVLRQVISGDGGVGKSQIAAGWFGNSCAVVRVWVKGESVASILSGYAEAAVRLDLADRDAGVKDLACCFLGFLASTAKSWLVIIDDLGDPADMTGLWPPTGGQVVLTTRRRDGSLSGGGRKVLDVGVYNPIEAQAYLDERLTPFCDELPEETLGESADLANDLGLLPLGLAQAAAVIIEQGITCGEYRSRFADRARSLDELFPAGSDGDGYARTVATTWVLAAEAANRLDPVGVALPLAHFIAVCDPAGTPESLFTSESCCAYLAAALGSECDAGQARGGIRALGQLSLVTHKVKGRDPRSVRMHNLTARAILHTLDSDTRVGLVRMAAYALLEVWPRPQSDTALLDAVRATAQTLTLNEPDALWGEETGGHLVLFKVGRSLQNAGSVGSAIAYYQELMAEAETRLGPDHRDTLASRNSLALAYRQGGDLGKAVSLFEQNVADRERVLSPDHPDTLTSRDNLAGAYHVGGDLVRAISLFKQTLADRERVLGPHHPDTLTSRNNLALTFKAGGDLVRATSLFEQTFAESERVRGSDHPDTLTSRNNLALAYWEGGDLGKAVPLLELNLAENERVLGPDHPNTLASLTNLAVAYRESGNSGDAVPLHEQNLADFERVLGPDHPTTLTSRNNLAVAYREGGDLRKAVTLLELNLAENGRVLGPDHPDTLTARNNLALAYREGGDLGKAVPLLELNLAEGVRVLGPDNPNIPIFRTNLAISRSSEAGRQPRRMRTASRRRK